MQTRLSVDSMRKQILDHLDQPQQLEKIYRSDKSGFTMAFQLLYPEILNHPVANFWYARLNYKEDSLDWGTPQQRWLVVFLCLLAGSLANLPLFTGVSESFFYPRNITFIVFPFLTCYFLLNNKAPWREIMKSALLLSGASLYINLLPGDENHDTFILACVHLPVVLWGISGFAFAGPDWKDLYRRLDYLRFNGDLLVMTAIILIAGGILTAITFGLFSLIGISIDQFYMNYIVVWGLASVPIFATHLVQVMPQLVERVSPVIARVFTPLVLVMLMFYLAAVLFTGKDPYNDREFLLIFNGLLVAVMALVLFSVVGSFNSNLSRFGYVMLLGLSFCSLAVNFIALSAILFRISEWGITPNRMAVLGSNLLIMIHLLLVFRRLYGVLKKERSAEDVGRCIVAYLPYYIVWAATVAVLFPVFFGFV